MFPLPFDLEEIRKQGLEPGYWNGEACGYRIVNVVVGSALRPTFWFASMAGTQREAVEVHYAGQPPFYIDNEGNEGVRKLTIGKGLPNWAHQSLKIERVVE
jgi:hypothetical protein